MSPQFTPFFLPSGEASLFCVHYPAFGDDEHSSKAVIYLPAFAEEMNKSRRMVSMQAQALARAGTAGLVIDLYGTGDSSGGFSDARWSLWKKNIEMAVGWLREQGYQQISFVALRLGGLLALDFMEDCEEHFDKLIWWQPVSNGETHLMQFLRLRIASAMFSKEQKEKETTKTLRERLIGGEIIEVAGYDIHPELAIELIDKRTQTHKNLAVQQIEMIELVSKADKPCSPVVNKLAEQWNEAGLKASAQAIVGDHFWNTQEIAVCPELIDRTAAQFT